MREVVLRIIFAMYREHRAAVLEYLPPDDASARKTVRYKTLFEGFAKIDGKSSGTELRVCHERQNVQGHFRHGFWLWCPGFMAGLGTVQVAECLQVCEKLSVFPILTLGIKPARNSEMDKQFGKCRKVFFCCQSLGTVRLCCVFLSGSAEEFGKSDLSLYHTHHFTKQDISCPASTMSSVLMCFAISCV